MRLLLLPMPFAVLQLAAEAQMEELSSPFVFWARTDEELSLVCPEAVAPSAHLEKEPGWRALRVAGKLDFSLIGVLSRLTGVLAEAEIGVFVVSTYLTDYILVREAQLAAALRALRMDGHEIGEPY